MTKPARFRQSDVTRALQGAAKAGMPVSGFEICPKTGNLRVFTGTPAPANDTGGANEWDVLLET